jgi:hypothetical protein
MTGRSAPVIAALAVAFTAACSGGSGKTPAPEPTPSRTSSCAKPGGTYTSPPANLPVCDVELSTAPPPWLAPATVDNGAESASYVAAAGLPWAEEMLAVHYHAHLDIVIDGEKVTVPAGLGFVLDDGDTSLAPLHTHDDSGIIHIENDVPATFSLGQVFIEWGVRLTADCIGAACAGDGKELTVFVDGKRYDGDPTRLVLARHQEIAIEYGDTGHLPEPPSAYEFPEGL